MYKTKFYLLKQNKIKLDALVLFYFRLQYIIMVKSRRLLVSWASYGLWAYVQQRTASGVMTNSLAFSIYI